MGWGVVGLFWLVDLYSKIHPYPHEILERPWKQTNQKQQVLFLGLDFLHILFVCFAWGSQNGLFAVFCWGFFPTCQVRVVRFYVSTGPPPPPSPRLLLLLSSSSTAILWVQCGVLDPNRDPGSSVWRAGPQPRSCECSVASRTPTAILRVQCGVPDPNCDLVSSVLYAGPQLRSCEFSVACRTSTVMARIGSSCRKSVSKK